VNGDVTSRLESVGLLTVADMDAAGIGEKARATLTREYGLRRAGAANRAAMWDPVNVRASLLRQGVGESARVPMLQLPPELQWILPDAAQTGKQ